MSMADRDGKIRMAGARAHDTVNGPALIERGTGSRGPDAAQIQSAFGHIADGRRPKSAERLTPC